MKAFVLEVLSIMLGVVLAEIVIRSMVGRMGHLMAPGSGAGGGVGE